MPPIFPNAPFNPPKDQHQTPGEIAAQQARLILASINPDILAAMSNAAAAQLQTMPPTADPGQQKVLARIKRKIDKAPDFFVQRTPTAAKLAEFLLLLELPFFQLKQPRQRAEIKGGFDTAAMYFLLARPGLMAYGVNSAVAELRIRFSSPGPQQRQFEDLARQQAQAIRTAPENGPENAGWNDYHLGRYMMLGTPHDLYNIVTRYQGRDPEKVKDRQMITLTARWMVNSMMQQHEWFRRAFEKAWYMSGDRRPLPILPDTDQVKSMFIDAEPEPGAPN